MIDLIYIRKLYFLTPKKKMKNVKFYCTFMKIRVLSVQLGLAQENVKFNDITGINFIELKIQESFLLSEKRTFEFRVYDNIKTQKVILIV